METRPTVDGTMELYALAKKDNFMRKMVNRIDKERTGIKNMFIKYMSQNEASSVDFGKLGYVNWSERKGSSSRTFSNRTKEAPDENVIEQEFNKLNYNSF